MPLVRTIRRKGSVVTVEAHAEVLFTPNGPVGNFARRFTRLVKDATAGHAPGNSRPTWGHEPAAHGKPLKSSFKAATRYRPDRLKIYSAVGSSAPYAAFVDQGTGVYAGHSPWLAKILPPTSQFGSDLYESTWRPGGKPVREVWIKGQKPQRFFQHGIEDAMTAMRIPHIKVPGDLIGPEFPNDVVRHVTASIDYGAGSAFDASLKRWREQRDKAWLSGHVLGTGSFSRRNTRAAENLKEQRRQALNAKRARNKPSAAKVQADNRRRQKKFRDDIARSKGRTIDRTPKPQISAASERERVRFTRAATDRYPASRGYDVTVRYDASKGRYTAVVTGPGLPPEGRALQGRLVT